MNNLKINNIRNEEYYQLRELIKNALILTRLDTMQHLPSGSTFRLNLEEVKHSGFNTLTAKLKITLRENHDIFEEDIIVNIDKELLENDPESLLQVIICHLIEAVKNKKHFVESRDHPARYISIRNKIQIIRWLKLKASYSEF